MQTRRFDPTYPVGSCLNCADSRTAVANRRTPAAQLTARRFGKLRGVWRGSPNLDRITAVRGIILAGGTGSRLHPITLGTSKQLVPVYDKPMVYYPLSALMLAGIRDVLVITTPIDAAAFARLLGDGHQFGISISYAVQAAPEGLAQAFVLGRDHIGTESVALVLGDNIFYGPGLGSQLGRFSEIDGGTIFAYRVADPTAYGVVSTSSESMRSSGSGGPARCRLGRRSPRRRSWQGPRSPKGRGTAAARNARSWALSTSGRRPAWPIPRSTATSLSWYRRRRTRKVDT